jgi:hypothetical protein
VNSQGREVKETDRPVRVTTMHRKLRSRKTWEVDAGPIGAGLAFKLNGN